MELDPNPRSHAIVEAAKALGGSFKLVTLAPKNCKANDSTAQGNIKEWGHTNKSESTNEHTKQSLWPIYLFFLGLSEAAHSR